MGPVWLYPFQLTAETPCLSLQAWRDGSSLPSVPAPSHTDQFEPSHFATLEPNPYEGPKATATDARAGMIPQGYNWPTALFALATAMVRCVSYVGVAACPRILYFLFRLPYILRYLS